MNNQETKYTYRDYEIVMSFRLHHDGSQISKVDIRPNTHEAKEHLLPLLGLGVEQLHNLGSNAEDDALREARSAVDRLIAEADKRGIDAVTAQPSQTQ